MKLSIALDLQTQEENLALVDTLQDFDDIWFKVGLRSFIRDGYSFLEKIKNKNEKNKIFLDLKLYDIPNTMGDAAEEIAKFGVDMFNVHASAGFDAMSNVALRIDKYEQKPLILAVTALTSFDNESFQKVYGENIGEKANFFAREAHRAGLNGVVCSAHESRAIKSLTNSDFITLTPGIRPSGADVGDQKRVMTPIDAKDEMVDFIVVGRPIYKANNPEQVVEQILQEIQ